MWLSSGKCCFTFCHSSSVTKGMKGCKRRNEFSNTFTRNGKGDAAGSTGRRRNLAISTYQSQNSPHIKSYICQQASPNSNLSISLLTSPITRLRRLTIQRSSNNCGSTSISIVCPASVVASTLWKMNLAAFHSLLTKLRLDSTFPLPRLISFPGVLLLARAKRRASTPYSLIASVGLITFPRSLLIFSPCSSRINP